MAQTNSRTGILYKPPLSSTYRFRNFQIDLTDAGVMSTAVICPEKRNVLGLGQSPEQPLEKRAKLDDPQPADTATEGAKSGEGSSTHRKVIIPYCEICHGHVGHKYWDCPNKSKGMGVGCRLCYGPCKKKNDPEYDPVEHRCDEMVKHCVVCGNMGNHWADDCPYWTEEPPTNEYWSGGPAFVPF